MSRSVASLKAAFHTSGVNGCCFWPEKLEKQCQTGSNYSHQYIEMVLKLKKNLNSLSQILASCLGQGNDHYLWEDYNHTCAELKQVLQQLRLHHDAYTSQMRGCKELLSLK